MDVNTITLLFGIYVGVVFALTALVVVMTSDRYRDRFTWLVMDDPEDAR